MENIDREFKEHYKSLGLESVSDDFTSNLLEALPKEKQEIKPLINLRARIVIGVVFCSIVLWTSIYGSAETLEFTIVDFNVDLMFLRSVSEIVTTSSIIFCCLLLLQLSLITYRFKQIDY